MQKNESIRIFACFPTLPNLCSGKSKKSSLKKKETLDILKTSCKIFSMKFLEVNNFLRNYLQYFVKEVQSNSDCLEQICVSS